MLVGAFVKCGVKRIFGVPGGGSGLDIIEAAARAGIEFVLARDESAAVIMASVSAELNESLGVALTGRGPGLANAVNGIAHAALDRAPVLIISDGLPDESRSWVSHQSFNQGALIAPISKAQIRLDRADSDQIRALITLAMQEPKGPVFLELPPQTNAQYCKTKSEQGTPTLSRPMPEAVDQDLINAARNLVAQARRPVIIVGLESRDDQSAKQVALFAELLACPVLTTYKAIGVLDNGHSLFVGLFTGGSAEAECVRAADLIVLVGMDPVELIPQPWRYHASVLELSRTRHEKHYLTPDVSIYGDIATTLAGVSCAAKAAHWTTQEISILRAAMHRRLAVQSDSELDAHAIIEITQQAAPANHRISVDAGAHMISTMAFCRACSSYDVLISNGLATMAFALPAAIAAALHDPERPVIAITGDGGLLMCLGELATAVQQRCRIIVVVLNDSALSLIDIKQQKKNFQPLGVRSPRFDFGTMMQGFGGKAYYAKSCNEFAQAMAGAVKDITDGDLPVLIDVLVDPSAYMQQLDALRHE